MLSPGRRGFTLVELLVTVVILGVLASLAIPKYMQSKGKAQQKVALTDLRNLATAEDAFFADNNRYASDADIVPTTPATPDPTKMVFQWSSGNSGGAVTGTTTSWHATVTSGAARACAIYYNESPAAPASSDGVPACVE